MYIFNRITVTPQLPKRIENLGKIANNLWWSWNTDFLKLFKQIDIDLWERVGKNPIKFLKLVSQEKLENAVNNQEFLKSYDKINSNFEGYMNNKNTWFSKEYPNNKSDLIAYFSAEYGLDEILPIYSGGLGILSGDHLKSASDLGIPLVGVGLFYKNGYFHQKIDGTGRQETEYTAVDESTLPMKVVKDNKGNDLLIFVKFPEGKLYLKVWQINVGRVKLYLLDSDIDENIEAKIPSLTIQPLVENAIIHGIRKNGGCGTVVIGVKKEDGYTRVWVENDGIAIDLDVIKKVYSGEMPDNKIGLYNVHLRLKLIYGQGLNIYRLDPGTKMEFYI